ncbi:TlpA family protein disulfide reductase [Paraliomyxa miuraensis]|uniref:TlpA family protein disulfide reductase n=1 Tax=Paraliomyxa miuraensis TaxID=376150 RepID=UPI00225104C6|nr:TlpA disulfide reductase family protein [Paraliomyxa miuraensis]MCX4246991.1 TlpA family protein disulfide reductase [Paraliomyxa miuraensis]
MRSTTRRVVLAGSLVGTGGLAACVLGSGGAGTNEGTVTPSVTEAPSALAGQEGQPLELSVPLLGGGRQDLAELRGRPVLLELADGGWAEREPTQARYRALVERRGDGIAVVCVAFDADASTLPASWIDHPPPFVLGWDPQQALAARLRLRVLPTVVLLDGAGTIVSVHEGAPPDDATLERWAKGG